jgi:hypothetical protein
MSLQEIAGTAADARASSTPKSTAKTAPATAPRGRRTLGAMLAGLTACAALVSGCSSSAPAGGPNDGVLIDSGTTGGVAWDLWAWEDNGQLCMGPGTESGPYTSTDAAAPGAMSGSQCGFSDKTKGATYYASAQNTGNGPPTVALLFGPVPAAAVAVRVTGKITLKTAAFPSGAGLPSARYWVWAAPYQVPASDGTVLSPPEPLDAQGKAVAFQAY